MITVEEIKLAIQCMVNSYKGEYGKVVKVFNDPQCFKIRFVEGFTAVQGDTLYIVHQGSHEWKDWMYDFMAWHSKVKKITAYGHINSDIEVHTGFNTEHQIDINRILDLVKAHPECKEVKTYGHSLGAAISTLTAIDIKTAFPDRNVTCITGGSPRVGNDTFVEVWNKLIPNSI